ncbi:hypothetical protein ACVWW2_002597 [Bradyrhizobium sp. LM4.3]
MVKAIASSAPKHAGPGRQRHPDRVRQIADGFQAVAMLHYNEKGEI